MHGSTLMKLNSFTIDGSGDAFSHFWAGILTLLSFAFFFILFQKYFTHFMTFFLIYATSLYNGKGQKYHIVHQLTGVHPVSN